MNIKHRREEADEILTHVCKYLERAGWVNEHTSFQWLDPEEGLHHRTDFAFCIQTSRDLGGGMNKNMEQWKTIESAPKDGTSVVIWGKDITWTGIPVIASYFKLDIEWWHVDDGKHGPFPLRGPSPTHWMHVPNPPEINT